MKVDIIVQSYTFLIGKTKKVPNKFPYVIDFL